VQHPGVRYDSIYAHAACSVELSGVHASWLRYDRTYTLAEHAGMFEICSFKSLQSLRIEKTILDCSDTSAAFGQLSTMTALTQLKVINLSVTPTLLCSFLTRLPYLKSLKVVHTSGPLREIPGMLDCITALKSLEDVDLEGLKVPWKVLDMLPAAKSITMSCPAADVPAPKLATSCKVCG
jgi:hypothetical protein